MTQYTKEEIAKKQINANRQKWLDQLRSPGAKKYTHGLESIRNSNARCCLGHACHALGIERSVREYTPGKYIVYYEDNCCCLPLSVCKMLDITPNGRFKKQILSEDEYVDSLGILNYNAKLSLKKIADIIEEKFENNDFYSAEVRV